MQTLYGIDWTPKDPVVLDEVKLKQEACSHIEKQLFMDRVGEKSWRCPACGLWESGDTTL
jgi:ribosomal protein L37AE/L43A